MVLRYFCFHFSHVILGFKKMTNVPLIKVKQPLFKNDGRFCKIIKENFLL